MSSITLTKAEKKALAKKVKKWLSFAQTGNIQGLKSMITEIDVNIGHIDSGRTALHEAAASGYKTAVELLISQYNAQVEVRDKTGRSPLHEAACFGHYDVVEILLGAKADVNALKRTDWTPLMLAGVKNHIQVGRLLIDSGANAFLVNKDGWTVLHLVAREGHVQFAKLLLSHIGPKLWQTTSKSGRTPLMTAALACEKSMVKLLLEMLREAEKLEIISQVDKSGMTALLEAASVGELGIMKQLIAFGGDDLLSAQNVQQQTVAHLASLGGHNSVIDFLVQGHPQQSLSLLNQQDMYGTTPLHLAALQSHETTCKILLSYGAKLEAKNKLGRTPLMLACNWSSWSSASVLVELGASLTDQYDNEGKSALDFIPSDSDPKVKEDLLAIQKKKGEKKLG